MDIFIKLSPDGPNKDAVIKAVSNILKKQPSFISADPGELIYIIFKDVESDQMHAACSTAKLNGALQACCLEIL